jgi:hypothetical protein
LLFPSSKEKEKWNGRALLLCHGTFSSTEKAFTRDLITNLEAIYRNNILAYDHFTLSKKPDQNACDLLEKLNQLQLDGELELDIICHSRGALVIRNLLENRNNQEALNKRISIKKVIFVAGACLGTQLANPGNLAPFFKKIHFFTWFFGGSTNFKAILAIIELLVLGVQKLPGIEAMDPAGKEIADLNAYMEQKEESIASNYLYIRANYDFEDKVWHYLEHIFLDHDIFKDSGNDLVVPFEGAGTSTKYQQALSSENRDIGTESITQCDVHHINFFDQCEIRKRIVKFLK